MAARIYQDDILKDGRQREYTISDTESGFSNITENPDALEVIGSSFGTSNAMGDMVLECNVSVSGSTVTISHPSGAPAQFWFIAPRAYSATDTYQFQQGSNPPVALNVVDTSGETLSDEAWVSGVPVTLTRQGDRAFFKQGGGLNYRVLAVASESALPATARNNALAVVTTDAITGYTFDTNKPDPAEGLVWFAMDKTAAINFDALTGSTKSIRLVPAACRQYVGGAWRHREFHHRNGEAWDAYTDLVLLFGGALIDGFEIGTIAGSGVNTGYGWSLNNLTAATNRNHAMVVSTDPLDFAPYTSAVAKLLELGGSSAPANNRGYLGLHSGKVISSTSNSTPQNLLATGSYVFGATGPLFGTEIELTLDISAILTSGYIATGSQIASSGTSSSSMMLKELRLKK